VKGFVPCWILGLSALLVPLGAEAHQGDSPNLDPAPRPAARSRQSPQNFGLELRIGPYRPEVDSEFGGAATPFRDTFGGGTNWLVGAEFDFQLLRIPYIGSIGPGIQLGYVSYSASAPFADGSGLSAHPTAFWALPGAALLALRIDVFAREFGVPLVPYAKGGLALVYWQATDAARVSSDSAGSKGQRLETGYVLQAGLALQLSGLFPQAARDMDASGGVNTASVFFEGDYSQADSFGQGMQVGTTTWTGGLFLEF
jgi:hypothetical protein